MLKTMLKTTLKNPKYIKIAIIASAILIALALYLFLKPSAHAPQDIKVVDALVIAKKNLSQTIRLTGRVKARNSARLMAKSPGILNVIVPAGTKVEKDTIIAKINNTEIEKRYTLSGSAEVIAKEQFERAKNLFKSGAYSKAELESLLNKWISAQKDLADSKVAYDKLQFYAPFDGIVGNYKFREGAQLKGDEIIVSFYDPTNIALDFDIPASIVPEINNGQNILVLGQNYQLTHVQKMLDDERHMSPASLDIICSDCIIGSNLDLDLTIKSKENVIVIPFDAVVIRAGIRSVYIIKDNIANLKEVQLGIRQKEEVEIISGLEVGETIVAKSTNRLYPGALVKINE
jgi:membrane fusion protein (multidrug efflux system)